MEQESASGSGPRVIAHRGFSGRAPENTLAAFRMAIEVGADGVECDVRLSADGEVVVIHDATLERTTDGEGSVEERTVGSLRRLDAGGWKSPEFEGERIPTLAEVIRETGGRIDLAIEIKAPGIEEKVVEALTTSGGGGETEILCFDRATLETIGRLDPGRSTVWLFAELPDDPARELSEIFGPARRAGIRILGVSRSAFSEAFLDRARVAGFSVYVWTVNDRAEIESLARAGVDAITSDRPDLVLEVLNRPPRPR